MEDEEAARSTPALFIVPKINAAQFDVTPHDGETLVGGQLDVPLFREFAEDPGLRQRPSADHDGGAAGFIHAPLRVVPRKAVPVADDRNGDLGNERLHMFPRGGAPVPLRAAARVKRDGVNPGGNRGAGDLQVGLFAFGPPETQLDRDGNLHCGLHGRDDRRDLGRAL